MGGFGDLWDGMNFGIETGSSAGPAGGIPGAVADGGLFAGVGRSVWEDIENQPGGSGGGEPVQSDATGAIPAYEEMMTIPDHVYDHVSERLAAELDRWGQS